MNKLSKYLSIFSGCLGLFLIVNSCSSYLLVQDADPKLPKIGIQTSGKNLHKSTIRLVTPEGYFYCSGFVVDANYAITAAHCVESTFGFMSYSRILIRDSNNEATSITAQAVAIDKFRDVAFIHGNFADFQAAEVDFEGSHIKAGMLMESCGFPSGQDRMYCSHMILTANDYFRYRTLGPPIFKGMSGGPVMDSNNVVVGVNSAVDESTLIIGPLVGVLENVGLR